MRKLTNRKILSIIARKNLNYTNKEIADRYGISKRYVRELYSYFIKNNKPPEIHKPGKTAKPITSDDEKAVLQAYEIYKAGSDCLEKLIGIPHNRIQMILKKNKLANNEPNKQKQKKWVRYEREHSLSLVHMDWHEYNGKHIILVEDDAARTILAGGEFDASSEENSIAVLKKAMAVASVWNSEIRQVLTDNGAEFTITNRFNENYEIDLMNHGFEKFLSENGISHTYTRRSHPQTNGKLERLFGTHDLKRHHFKTLNEFIDWYNNLKPHKSLDYQTPTSAFRRKLRQEELLGLAFRMFKW